MPQTIEKTLLNGSLSEENKEEISLEYGRIMLQDGRRWLSFKDPVRIIAAYKTSEVKPALQKIEQAVAERGLYAAGFMAYEAAAAYDLAVHPAQTDGLPLLWFGLYEQPEEYRSSILTASSADSYQLGKWQTNFSEEVYAEAIENIKSYIACGDTYQVNFTMRLQTQFRGDPLALFSDLAQAQRADYTAFLDVGSHVVCSASPELFFRLEGNKLTSRPMKGTAHRGRTLEEDRQHIADLQTSIKNQAENVMIVDMIRNDFGRIAKIGSVKVPHLFTVEKYPTLLQMTSTVTAESDTSLPQIMEAMFPCASITGAPKVRTMQIIQELEAHPRGVYTGAIGYWGPERQAQFNVAIRTVVIERETGLARYGVGSGIVWDSDAMAEYDECRLKSAVLTRRLPNFDLLETLRWTPEEGYFLLDYHLERIKRSAEYFEFPLSIPQLQIQLREIESKLSSPYKVRILLDSDGQITSQAVSLAEKAIIEPLRVGLASKGVDSSDLWLYHKTTRRGIYNEALASRPDCDEVLLWNERGELTEAANANIVMQLDGDLFTPPVASGLLGGTFRQYLLEQAKIKEKIITMADLQRCNSLFLINSVRKWIRADFVDSDLSLENFLQI